MISSVRALAPVGQDHRAQAVEQVWERGPHGPGAPTIVQRIPGGRFVLLLHQAQRHQAPHQVQALDRFPAALIVDALVETTAGTSRATVNLVLQASTRRGIVPVDPVLTGGEQ
jgi:hypothetical protein